jgi:ribonuclease Z
MNQRPLGSTGLTVSELGFGCGSVGGLMVRGDPADQRRAVARALDAGITYFDTAPSYGDGRSEENLGRALHDLDAIFLTHIHSDHVVDLDDVVMTRWLQGTPHPAAPLPIIAVDGHSSRFAAAMLDAYIHDIDVRVAHVQPGPPTLDIRPFPLSATPVEVWCSNSGDVRVEAVAVHHEPVPEAVAYRITTPTAVVVISGDTRVCDEVLDLARGADVLVHEACRSTPMRSIIEGTPFEHIFDYHADTVALGSLATTAGVGHLVLTHLIPPPATPDDEAAFAADVRSGGYLGPLTVGHDLFTVEVP